MGKKLSQMTWAELKKEMSLAGDAEECIEIAKDIQALMSGRVNFRNIPTLINLQLVLRRLEAEIKTAERMERQRQHPKT